MADLINKVVRFHEFGPAEVLRVENAEVREPGPGEVRIKVAAIGLNFAETLFRRNQYFESAKLPAGLGYEASGTVDKLGPGVTGFAVGDKVATFPAHSQRDYPAYGEWAIMPATSVAHYPTRLSEVEAASYWTAYLTGYFALIEIAKLTSSQTVLITAASSSTGLAAIEIAKSVGARVIATTRTSQKASALRNAGADIVIATEVEDLVGRVLAETGDKGVDVAYDAVGGKQLSVLGRIIKPRGHLILYGVRSGEDIPAPLYDLWIKSIEFHLYMMFNFTGSESLGLMRNQAAMERAISFINSGIERGIFTPRVDRTFMLDDVVAAHRYMEAGNQIGKIVITV
jgi:NADPH:quinone reductase-like Zn-dependent oxidoreductase